MLFCIRQLFKGRLPATEGQLKLLLSIRCGQNKQNQVMDLQSGVRWVEQLFRSRLLRYEAGEEQCAEVGHAVQVVSALLDWDAVRQAVLPGYDVILGADLMYIKEAGPQLAALIPHLCKPLGRQSPEAASDRSRGTLLLMADPETRTPQNR